MRIREGALEWTGLRWPGLALVITTACSTHSGAPSAGDAGPPPSSLSCPTGLTAASDGQGCIELAAPDPCPPGSAPFLGSASCQPVGWTDPCPAGMQADPSGWGCIEIVTATTCSDTTTERLGQPGCVPVGDCTAAFPPANATLFVSAAFTQEDATHFKTVAGAVAQATSGAVIAVDSGTYADNIEATVPITVIGRCASQVTLANTNTGLYVTAKAVVVQGLTLKGHSIGVAVEAGGSLSLTDAIVLDSAMFGLYVEDPTTVASLTRVRIAGTLPSAPGAGDGWGVELFGGGSVTLTDCALVDNTTVGIGGIGQATVTGTLIARQKLDTPPGDGFGIQLTGGRLTVSESAILGSHSAAVSIAKATMATITQSVLRGTIPDTSGVAHGIVVLDGAHAQVTSSAITEMEEDCVLAAASGSATLTNTVLRGPLPARSGTWGAGAFAEMGGQVELDGCAVVGATAVGVGVLDKGSTANVNGSVVAGTLAGPEGVGAVAQSGATLTVTNSSIIDTTSVGVTAGTNVGPATVHLSGTLIRDTHLDAQGNGGDGAQATGGSTLDLQASAVVDSVGVGVSIGGNGAKANVQQSVIRASAVLPSMGMFGYGLVASVYALVTMQGSYVRDNPGVGVTFSRSTGSLEGSWIATNGIGVVAQDGSYLAEGTDAGTPLPSDEVFVSTDTMFTGNGNRIGSSGVPLPPISFRDGGIPHGGQ